MEQTSDKRTMTVHELKPVVEGLLFMTGEEGLTDKQLAEVCDSSETEVRLAVELLRKQYEEHGHGLQVLEIAGAYHLGTLATHAPFFQKLAQSPTTGSITQASLETLAIVAYRQPITRVEIEEIRGVKSDRSLQTLTNKGLIMELGRSEAVGRPILYGTTKLFLDHFGLNSVGDLPEPQVELDENTLEEETRMLFEKLDANQNK